MYEKKCAFYIFYLQKKMFKKQGEIIKCIQYKFNSILNIISVVRHMYVGRTLASAIIDRAGKFLVYEQSVR